MISIDDVTVAYGGFVLLDRISFHISGSDRIGLVGRNGAGKSTIMKLIMGLQNPTSGHIDKPSSLTIGYLPQLMEHNKGRTVLEETMTVFSETSGIQDEIDALTRELGERSDYDSEEYAALIETAGGIVQSSVTSKTRYLIAGANVGATKTEKARALGTEVIDEARLLELLG